MISRSPLRPPASLFSKHGVCLFCRASKLQAPLARGYASRPRPSPFTRTREREKEPINKNRSAEELVARQLGHKYIPGSEHEPRLPMEIFVQAYRSGRIRIPPGPAQRILRDFEPVMKKASAATTLLSMCSDLLVHLDDLTGLGALVLQSKNPLERFVARNILLCASRAGSPSATIYLVNKARKDGTLAARELVNPQVQLKQLVESDPTNIQALVLQGKLYQNQGKNSLAASLYRQAIDLPQKNTDDKGGRLKQLLDFVGFENKVPDPNLDIRRPEELELDVVQAHMELSHLQFKAYEDEAAKDNLKVAALKYDEPVAYYRLAQTEDRYSMKWLEYTRKAAASGWIDSMEDMGEIHSWSEQELKEKVKDERVRDWILNNPLFGDPQWITRFTSSLTNAQQNDLRTLTRYKWAREWYLAAIRRSLDHEREVDYKLARIHWSIADLLVSIGQAPSWQLRSERVFSLRYMDFVLGAKNVDPNLKRDVEVIMRQMMQEPMGREARVIDIHWQVQGKKHREDEAWLLNFLRSIDKVPLGQWK